MGCDPILITRQQSSERNDRRQAGTDGTRGVRGSRCGNRLSRRCQRHVVQALPHPLGGAQVRVVPLCDHAQPAHQTCAAMCCGCWKDTSSSGRHPLGGPCGLPTLNQKQPIADTTPAVPADAQTSAFRVTGCGVTPRCVGLRSGLLSETQEVCRCPAHGRHEQDDSLGVPGPLRSQIIGQSLVHPAPGAQRDSMAW